ncbi:MAG: hypothetical protein ACTHLJ_10720 [Angustibacter sp.]
MAEVEVVDPPGDGAELDDVDEGGTLTAPERLVPVALGLLEPPQAAVSSATASSAAVGITPRR